MATLVSKTYKIQTSNNTTSIEKAWQARAAKAAQQSRHADSCDYCGRLAKRVRGVALCPTCAGF